VTPRAFRYVSVLFVVSCQCNAVSYVDVVTSASSLATYKFCPQLQVVLGNLVEFYSQLFPKANLSLSLTLTSSNELPTTIDRQTCACMSLVIAAISILQ